MRGAHRNWAPFGRPPKPDGDIARGCTTPGITSPMARHWSFRGLRCIPRGVSRGGSPLAIGLRRVRHFLGELRKGSDREEERRGEEGEEVSTGAHAGRQARLSRFAGSANWRFAC